MRNFFIFALIFFLQGCLPDRYDGSLHSLRYHDDAQVMLSPVHEAVYPISMPESALKALVVPFALSQDLGVRKDIARELTEIFQLSWLEKEVFPVLEYASAQPWAGLDQALDLARTKGANILVTGNIGQYFEGGGATGRTSIGLSLNIYWVPEARLLWSATQAGALEGGLDKDYVLVRSTRRLPENPVYVVMRSLSLSLGQVFTRHGF